MDQVASSVSIASSASTSPVSSAVAYRCARSATARSPSARRVWSWLRIGRAAVAVDRARCRALVTDATDAAAALELVQPAPGAEQGVLHGILGVLDRAEHPVALA